jgi:hypothetical protein
MKFQRLSYDLDSGRRVILRWWARLARSQVLLLPGTEEVHTIHTAFPLWGLFWGLLKLTKTCHLHYQVWVVKTTI